MTKNNKKRNFKGNFNLIADTIKGSKIVAIILCTLLVITLLTGIIVAIKSNVNYDKLQKIGVVCFDKSGFFWRFLSMLFVALICFGCSFSDWLMPFAMLFLCYRSYLLGVNLCLIISVNGIGGVVSAILIVLPCQLLALITLAIFYLLLRRKNKDFKCYGRNSNDRQKGKVVIFTLFLLLAICLLESLLQAIFSPTIILVI